MNDQITALSTVEQVLTILIRASASLFVAGLVLWLVRDIWWFFKLRKPYKLPKPEPCETRYGCEYGCEYECFNDRCTYEIDRDKDV
jgi:hypothetical protein